MLQNYLKIAFRNILRNKVFSFINILGLAIGLAVSIIILVYVKHELSYDKFHENYQNIYQMGLTQAQGENISYIAITSPTMGPESAAVMPEIKKCVRLSTPQAGTYEYGNESFKTGTAIYADSSFFNLFSFKLLIGDKNKVLQDPNSVVLSKSTAKKIFKDEDPIGKQLKYHSDIILTVTGICDDVPTNSIFKFNSVVSFTTYSNKPDFGYYWDGNFSYYTYVEIEDNTNINDLESKLEGFFYEKINKNLEALGWKILPFFEPIADVYLNSKADYNFSTGNKTTVRVFISVVIFLLVIASINFMNLSTALSFKRFKEVAVRKVSGASKTKIIHQFLNESAILSFISLVLALIFIEMLMPGFNRMFNSDLSFYTRSNTILILLLPLMTIVIGIISGFYPAFIMSGFKPINLIKGYKIKGNRKLSIQNLLVVIQFVISTVLIISTTVIYFQINYLTHKDLGFDKENLMGMSLYNTKSYENSDVIRDRLLKNSNIINATVASNYPKSGLTSNGYVPEGYEKPVMFNALYVDYNYIKTLGFKIVKGRDFDPNLPTDKEKLIINETLAKELGWDDPIGKYIERNGRQEVIGVVKDFHFNTLHEKIAPIIITMYPRKKLIIARVKEENVQGTIDYMKKQWTEVTGDNNFNYFFISDTFKNLYHKDENFAKIIMSFSVLAIFIACLGLFGLTAFITTRRVKEIGIRKALGASTFNINKLIIKEFIVFVLISFVFAWPLAYYLMNKWLQNYAYKINLHIGYFIMASLVALIIAVITLSYHSIRAARTNPAESLQYE